MAVEMLSRRNPFLIYNSKLPFANAVGKNAILQYIDLAKIVRIIMYAKAASKRKDIHIIIIYFLKIKANRQINYSSKVLPI